MRRITILLFVLMLLGHFPKILAQYCVPEFPEGCVYGDQIENFEMPLAGFSHLETGCSPASFGDFTDMTITLMSGIAYDYEVTHNFDNQNIKIWVDFDEDESFSELELLSTASSENINSVQTSLGSLLISTDVTPGVYRMRVMDVFSSNTFDACNSAANNYGEVHDYLVDVLAAPSCFPPTAMSVESVTNNSINLSWLAGGSETVWNLEWAANSSFIPGSGEAEGTMTIDTTPTYQIDGLMANTTYYIYYQADCGGGDMSVWYEFIYTTACGTSSEFMEGFETTPAGGYLNYTLPDCWTTIFVGEAYGHVIAWGGEYPNTGANSYMIFPGYDGAGSMLISPMTDNLGNGNNRLNFYARHEGQAVSIEVGTMSDPSDASTFTSLETIALNDSYNQYFVNLPAGTDDYFAFKHAAGSYNNIILDDISYEIAPSCLEPSGMVVSGMDAFTANLNWQAGNAETNWNIEWNSNADFTPGTGESEGMQAVNDTPELSLMDLSDDTDYYVYYQADCGDGDTSSWIGPVMFHTFCDVFTSDFFENFDSAPLGAWNNYTVPNCWSSLFTGDGYGNIVDFSFPYSGSQHYEINGGSNGETYLISPLTENLGSGVYRLVFHVRGGEFNNPAIEVGTMADPLNANSYTAVETFANLSTDYTEYTVYLPQTTDDFFAFRYIGGDWGNVWLDDITFELTPSCIEPSEMFTSAITPTTATLSWNQGNTETTWNLEWSANQDFTPGMGEAEDTAIVNAASTLDLTDLEEGSTYYIYYQADCGSGDISSWEAFTFETPFSQQIGSGEEYSTLFPINSCFGYNYSQQIYMATELDAITETNMNTITSIRFKMLTISDIPQNFTNWDIYLGNTTKSNFESAADWVPFEELSPVFLGNITFMDNSWVEIEFTQPFEWDGTSNLVIAVDENTTGYSCTAEWAAYETGANRAILAYVDNINIDPSSPPTQADYDAWLYSHSMSSVIPQISFVLEESLSTSSYEHSDYISFYPNPVKDQLTIKSQNSIDKLVVTNMLGQTINIQKPASKTYQLNMDNFKPGTYFIEISSKNHRQTFKILKK